MLKLGCQIPDLKCVLPGLWAISCSSRSPDSSTECGRAPNPVRRSPGCMLPRPAAGRRWQRARRAAHDAARHHAVVPVSAAALCLLRSPSGLAGAAGHPGPLCSLCTQEPPTRLPQILSASPSVTFQAFPGLFWAPRPSSHPLPRPAHPYPLPPQPARAVPGRPQVRARGGHVVRRLHHV